MDYGICSIIIPVYNVREYLDDCLKSILNQTYKNYEVILVDDGSTDGSAEICDKYALEKNIKVIHENNAGVSCARNAGLIRSSGKYISFVDPDDIIEMHFLERLIWTLLENSTDVACCSYYRFGNAAEIINNISVSGGGIKLAILNHLKSCSKKTNLRHQFGIRYTDGKLYSQMIVPFMTLRVV